ncbi:MAG: AbrB/MazE/SpoVT family DNA-binding domain-containing protein [Phycisphaerae bacterium]|nr:AbrB/MazE/SpoVT family DNA-binding domain-containing protein [Phycisphaerae bacterium]
MASAKISSKNQIVIPQETRDLLGLHAGDEVLIVNKGRHAILMAKPKSFTDALYGSAKGVYQPDPDTYLKQERESWNRRKSTRR